MHGEFGIRVLVVRGRGIDLGKRKGDRPSSSLGKRQRTSVS